MPIDGGVLEALLKKTGGNFRKSVVELKNLEDHAKLRRAECIDAKIFKEAA